MLFPEKEEFYEVITVNKALATEGEIYYINQRKHLINKDDCETFERIPDTDANPILKQLWKEYINES